MKSSGNFGKFIGMMFLVFLCMILLLAFMVQTCERVITDHKKETGKTMLQAIGEEARKAKDEFNKGFKPDSLKKVDSLKLKRDHLNDTITHIK